MKANIDVGASIGDTTLAMAAAMPDVPVYAFEPLEIGLLNEVAEANPLIHVRRLAVGIQEGPVDFFVNDPAPTCSLKPLVAEPQVREGSPTLKTCLVWRVRCIRLDTFMRKEKITEVPFLKIDAQGSDLEVLQSLGDRIDCVQRIQVEMHSIRPGDEPDWQYVGETKEVDVVAFLAEHGFKLKKRLMRDHGMWMDGMFER